MAARAALDEALREGRFESVAPILDAAELEVRSGTLSKARAPPQQQPHRTLGPNMLWTPPLSSPLLSLPAQSPDPDVLLNWPHALHILGHIYNGNLCARCAPRVSRPHESRCSRCVPKRAPPPPLAPSRGSPPWRALACAPLIVVLHFAPRREDARFVYKRLPAAAKRVRRGSPSLQRRRRPRPPRAWIGRGVPAALQGPLLRRPG
jgi:hypothetical protein